MKKVKSKLRQFFTTRPSKQELYEKNIIPPVHDDRIVISLKLEVVLLVIKELLKGVEEEGIFRISGHLNHVKEIYASFLYRPLLEEQGVHDICGAFKKYLRESPEPLIPFSFYANFMEIAQIKDNQPEQIKMMIQVIEKMPKDRQKMLEFIIYLCYEISKKSEINLMTNKNLGIVFGPTVMRPQSEGSCIDNAMAYQSSTTDRSNLVEVLISNSMEVFPKMEEDFNESYNQLITQLNEIDEEIKNKSSKPPIPSRPPPKHHPTLRSNGIDLEDEDDEDEDEDEDEDDLDSTPTKRVTPPNEVSDKPPKPSRPAPSIVPLKNSNGNNEEGVSFLSESPRKKEKPMVPPTKKPLHILSKSSVPLDENSKKERMDYIVPNSSRSTTVPVRSPRRLENIEEEKQENPPNSHPTPTLNTTSPRNEESNTLPLSNEENKPIQQRPSRPPPKEPKEHKEPTEPTEQKEESNSNTSTPLVNNAPVTVTVIENNTNTNTNPPITTSEKKVKPPPPPTRPIPNRKANPTEKTIPPRNPSPRSSDTGSGGSESSGSVLSDFSSSAPSNLHLELQSSASLPDITVVNKKLQKSSSESSDTLSSILPEKKIKPLVIRQPKDESQVDSVTNESEEEETKPKKKKKALKKATKFPVKIKKEISEKNFETSLETTVLLKYTRAISSYIECQNLNDKFEKEKNFMILFKSDPNFKVYLVNSYKVEGVLEILTTITEFLSVQNIEKK
eukprot:TRINITY_DN3880_c0_g1_i2.p1 TRINITY_DN3880_c0_g1~~TRINITY_DN3880_c0_g1_i2.p1  ORF type:complete len:737 (-),score=278.63 TRINITY_DN3880_c0_g1_i2:823-3009(-)